MSTDITDDLDYAQLFSIDLNDNIDDETHGVYNKGEHEIIDKYKERYFSAKSPSERKSLAQLEMFPALFDYWKKKGIVTDKKDTKIRAMVGSLSIFEPIFYINLFSDFYNGYGIHGARKIKCLVQNLKNIAWATYFGG
jgi:hypothetical protein